MARPTRYRTGLNIKQLAFGTLVFLAVLGLGTGGCGSSYLPNSQYTSDGVHPNAAGAQLMADAWYPALVAKNIP